MSLFQKAVPLLLLPLVAAALGACSSAKPKFQDDQLFSSTASPYSRNFDFPATDTCEAARRGLLSQGYMTTMTHTDAVDATKDFQPAPDSHVDVEVHVVCTAGDASNTSVMYVNAVQNGYALKKSDTSASVGLSIFGSLSLPIRTNSDAMVKISSETIQSGSFYEKFFDLVNQYLRTSVRSQPVPHGSIEITPLPPPVSPSPPVAVVTPPAPAAALASRDVAPVIGSGASAAVANDAHMAAQATVAATAAATAVETTASIQPPTSTAANAVMATLPGIGEPPIFTPPASYKLEGAPASGSAAQPAAAQRSAAQTSPAAQTRAAPTSNAPAAVAPAAASGATNTTPLAATPAANPGTPAAQ